MESILAAIALVIVGWTVASTKIVREGNQALVERLGRFHRTLVPGLNFIIPFVDTIVLEDTITEQVLDIPPQSAITYDQVPVEVDAVVFWRISKLEWTFYKIDNIETAIRELSLTTLRSEIGQMKLDETFASRDRINRALLQQLKETTTDWGVEVKRVEIQNLKPTQMILDSMERQKAAALKKQADILEAEGTVEAIRKIAEILRDQPNSKAVLQYLMTQRYVDANYKLSESPNSKIIFMDPKALSEEVRGLMEDLEKMQSSDDKIP